MELTQERQQKTYETLKERFGYENTMQTPQVRKVVVSVGTGSLRDKNKAEVIADRLAKITGQKPSVRPARKSIATFKLRAGDPVGLQVTLRGKRMYDFLNRLLHIGLPRTRDFRGIPSGSIDEMGNYTLGIREHTIFPETPDEEQRDIFGLSITVVTTATSKDEARAYLEHLGFPFEKSE